MPAVTRAMRRRFTKMTREYFQIQGTFYGYPHCCIEQFIDTFGIQPCNPKRLAGSSTGFIPCLIHSKQILNGKLRLKDLIQNRQCVKSFPRG